MAEEQQSQFQKSKKPIWGKWWFWVGGVIVFFMLLGIFSEDEKPQTVRQAEQQTGEQEEVKEVVQEEAVKERVPEQALPARYEIYKEWQDSNGIKQQVIIIPTELRNEKDLFAICDELDKKTKNEKRITIRGFTNKKAADTTMYVDKSPNRLWEFSDRELENINYHAVLAFDKSLTTPLKFHHCEIYPGGFGNQPFLSPKRY